MNDEPTELSYLDFQVFGYLRIFEGAKAAVVANPGQGAAAQNAWCTFRFVAEHINRLPDGGPFFTLLKTYINLFREFHPDRADDHLFSDTMASLAALMRDKFFFHLEASRQMSEGERRLAVETITRFLLCTDFRYSVVVGTDADGDGIMVEESARALWLRDFGIEGPSAARRAMHEGVEAAFRVRLLRAAGLEVD